MSFLIMIQIIVFFELAQFWNERYYKIGFADGLKLKKNCLRKVAESINMWYNSIIVNIVSLKGVIWRGDPLD